MEQLCKREAWEELQEVQEREAREQLQHLEMPAVATRMTCDLERDLHTVHS